MLARTLTHSEAGLVHMSQSFTNPSVFDIVVTTPGGRVLSRYVYDQQHARLEANDNPVNKEGADADDTCCFVRSDGEFLCSIFENRIKVFQTSSEGVSTLVASHVNSRGIDRFNADVVLRPPPPPDAGSTERTPSVKPRRKLQKNQPRKDKTVILLREDVDRSHLVPLLVFSKSDFSEGGICSSYLHLCEPETKREQILSWTPNEGFIMAVGTSHPDAHAAGEKGESMYVLISDGEENFIFEFTFK